MTTFNPQEYWENRLKKDFNLQGVGDIGLGVTYNKALYKVRRFAFHKLMKGLKINFSDKNVLDIGSGTGFYIERWGELNVKSIHGADITNVVVETLSKKFPNSTFTKLDIGEKIENPLQSYDIISAFDVLYHIVDDARFEQAIKNIHGLLNEKGYFVISDNFVHGETVRVKHQTVRTYEYLTKTIENIGFKLIKTSPMFVLMNDPVDTKNRFVKKFYWLITRSVRKNEVMGKLIGLFLSPIEKVLISLLSEGPTSEFKIYRKK